VLQRILVTGGAGFIGSHTVDLLLANHLKVTVLDNLASGHVANLNLTHPNLTFVEGDILNFPLLLKVLNDCDAVLHLAALSSVPQSIEDPLQSLKINTEGFVNVLQAIRQSNSSIRLVYASSASVYGNETKLPCSDEESLQAKALSPYALEKANTERYATLYEDLFAIKTLGLRYFNVYGPRQNPHSLYAGVISKFIECYQKNKSITIFGEGNQSRDFIHVKDVARANLLALQSDYCGVLNIATGRAETLLNLIHYLEEIGEKPAKIHFAPKRFGDITESYAAIDKAARHLRFHSELSLQQGIQSLVEIGYHESL
jgi:UDP-glucose 4-epimerase